MQKSRIVKFSIRNKMIAMALALVVPFFSMAIYLIFAIQSYSDAYNRIVGNMTIANNYNIDFKEEMDESLYKLVVGYTTFDTIKEDSSLEDPYDMIDQMRTEFTVLMGLTKDKESRTWLQSLLRNMDTLEDRVDDIRHNIADGETYDINIEMLDNNIYIMTEESKKKLTIRQLPKNLQKSIELHNLSMLSGKLPESLLIRRTPY